MPAKVKPQITFRRGRRFENAAASGTIWCSTCGQYRMRKSQPLGGLSVIFYAQFCFCDVWLVLSKHRSRSLAINACAHHAGKERRERNRCGCT